MEPSSISLPSNTEDVSKTKTLNSDSESNVKLISESSEDDSVNNKGITGTSKYSKSKESHPNDSKEGLLHAGTKRLSKRSK